MRCALLAGDVDRAVSAAWWGPRRLSCSRALRAVGLGTRVDLHGARGRQVSSGSTTHDLESGVGAGDAATSASASRTLSRLRLAQPAYLCRSWPGSRTSNLTRQRDACRARGRGRGDCADGLSVTGSTGPIRRELLRDSSNASSCSDFARVFSMGRRRDATCVIHALLAISMSRSGSRARLSRA
jgi:hypothetical protein